MSGVCLEAATKHHDNRHCTITAQPIYQLKAPPVFYCGPEAESPPIPDEVDDPFSGGRADSLVVNHNDLVSRDQPPLRRAPCQQT